MAHHHKSNRAVEGNPEDGHGRGLPRRPDQEDLAQRTQRDRKDVDLRTPKSPSPEADYQAERDEIDREVGAGEIPASTAPRKARAPYPPTRYKS
ncbi:hypothetical protein ABZV80_28825 [Streptomyces sp. NPDC005132]|uniref:hypothetical protein n=1 Tax=Streptomyces sp. NPDC005132 TaxID=3154294 RepID=UPI0033AD8FEF